MAAAEIVDLQQSGDWENYHKTGVSQAEGAMGASKRRFGERPRGHRPRRGGRPGLADRRARTRTYRCGPSGAPGRRRTSSSCRTAGCSTPAASIAASACRAGRLRSAASPIPRASCSSRAASRSTRSTTSWRRWAGAFRTSGASNGQTLPGACATATHGSVLNAGGDPAACPRGADRYARGHLLDRAERRG